MLFSLFFCEHTPGAGYITTIEFGRVLENKLNRLRWTVFAAVSREQVWLIVNYIINTKTLKAGLLYNRGKAGSKI